MSRLVAELREIHDSIGADLGTLTRDVYSLIATDWTGGAADFCLEHYEGIRSEAEAIMANAVVIADMIPESVRTYQRVDTDNSQPLRLLDL